MLSLTKCQKQLTKWKFAKKTKSLLISINLHIRKSFLNVFAHILMSLLNLIWQTKISRKICPCIAPLLQKRKWIIDHSLCQWLRGYNYQSEPFLNSGEAWKILKKNRSTFNTHRPDIMECVECFMLSALISLKSDKLWYFVFFSKYSVPPNSSHGIQ